ncbi:hypothetical protein HMPREF9412_4323 [Paenibacillus sp. HGF5]|nr:hypothetical protein HMPREF9412_4323 [Paenibacillus sp. HGF5]
MCKPFENLLLLTYILFFPVSCCKTYLITVILFLLKYFFE